LAQKKKTLKLLILILLFITYFFIAARPIPRETVLALNWITSLPGSSTSGISDNENGAGTALSAEPGRFIPFTLENRFGYINLSGEHILNLVKTSDIYLGQNMWTEYSAEPSNIVINNILNNSKITIDNPGGYPVLLDDRIFILGSEQNLLSEIGENGNVLWTYEFGAPLTAIDAAAGLVLTGSLDGAVEVFNSSGSRIFYFEPGGSRYSVILGCAISSNGSRIAVICGIDRQRFLLFERLGNTGGEYKIIYHEFLDTGFRRPVRVLFINDDQRVVFEREGGIGSYNIRSRRSIFIPLDGTITAIDELGARGFLFLVTDVTSLDVTSIDVTSLDVTSAPDYLGLNEKKLVGIKFPHDGWFRFSRNAAQDAIFLRAPFKSNDVFLGRAQTTSTGSMLVVGGGTALISFELEEK